MLAVPPVAQSCIGHLQPRNYVKLGTCSSLTTTKWQSRSRLCKLRNRRIPNGTYGGV